MIHEIPCLSDKLLEAFQRRRELLERGGFVGVRVFGSAGCPELTVIREFFDKNKVPHTWIDIDADEGRAAMAALGLEPDGPRPSPAPPATWPARPTVTRIAECHRPEAADPPRAFDLVIVGSGPAGLAAAVYGASEGLETLVLDRFGPGGQAEHQLADRELHGLPGRPERGGPGEPGATSRR